MPEVHFSRGSTPPFLLASHLSWRIADQLKGSPHILERSESEIAAFLLKDPWGGPAVTNMITGGDLKMEDSPGNFTIAKEPGKVLVRVYDPTGMALVRVYPKQAKGSPLPPQKSSSSADL